MRTASIIAKRVKKRKNDTCDTKTEVQIDLKAEGLYTMMRFDGGEWEKSPFGAYLMINGAGMTPNCYKKFCREIFYKFVREL